MVMQPMRMILARRRPAFRIAWAAAKRAYEKVGDEWVEKPRERLLATSPGRQPLQDSGVAFGLKRPNADRLVPQFVAENQKLR